MTNQRSLIWVSPALSSFIKPQFIQVAPPPLVVTQATDYTCGLAALQMAFARAGSNHLLTPDAQMAMHRDGHCGHMGEDEPGCSPHGLMAIALQAGFQATLHSANEACLNQAIEDCVLLPWQRPAFLDREQSHKNINRQAGGRYAQGDFTPALLSDILDRGGVPIVLTRDLSLCEHWVVVDGVKDGIVTISDPYANYRFYHQERTGSERWHIPFFALEERSLFGGGETSHAVLEISRPH